MNLDDFKEPWQRRQRELDGRVDHVIKKVRSRMAGFDRTIWFRDMHESFVAVILIAWYSYDLLQPQNLPGKCGAALGILACIGIIAVLHWAREKGKVARADLPVDAYCAAELERVDRQIWLLKNVHWWYLGPLFIAVAVQIVAKSPDPSGLIMLLTLVVPLFGFIYWLNRQAVRTQLMPLRQALILANEEDSEGHEATHHEKIIPLEPLEFKGRNVVIAVIALLVLTTAGAFLSEFVGVSDRAPKVSPFTEVQFEEQQIVVTYQKRKYQWLEIDGIKVEDIVEAAKGRFWGRWQKRVSEDLVDVLWGMDHQPGDTVSLLLRDLETSEQRVVEQAPMTTDNRFAVYQNRINDEIEAKASRNSNELSVEELKELAIGPVLRERLVGRYQLLPTFIFDVQDVDGHLMVGITNQPTQEVFPDSATRWSYRTVDAMLEFKLGPSGPAKRVILHQNGYRQSAMRIDE